MEAETPGPIVGALERISLELENASRISWAMERNGVPVVARVSVRNTGPSDLERLTLELRLGDEVGGAFRRTRERLAPGEIWEIGAPDLALDVARLRAQRERVQTILRAEVRVDDAAWRVETRSLDVLAHNEWSASPLPELLAAFVQPNSAAVAAVLASARDLLEARTGNPSIDGYQSRSARRAREIASAVYGAVQALGVTYVSAPASFESDGQKVRLPDAVREHRMGTCLDLSLLFASCLEQAGLHPCVVVEAGHAYPACWLVDDSLPQAASDDASTARKLVDAGDLLVLDATAAAARPAVAFEVAEAQARRFLAEPERFRHIVDVKACRIARILPLPLPGEPVALPAAVVEPPVAGPAPARDAEASRADARSRSRFDVWKERLLDLSLRNRLLNFRPSRRLSVPFDMPELAELEDRLAAGVRLALDPSVELEAADPRAPSLQGARGADEAARAQRLELLQRGRILTKLPRVELERRLLEMDRFARTEIEETGASTLYVAIGFVRWFETPESETPRLAPILLYPVELLRPKAGARFELRVRDDEPRLNETLFEKLKLHHQLAFPELATLPQDETGVDTRRLLEVLRKALARVPRFDVVDEAHVAFLSFTKFLLWRDLDAHQDAVCRSPLVEHLVGRIPSTRLTAGEFEDPAGLDDAAPPSRSRLVLDADSSQRVAVKAAIDGRTFVLQGPPGTGKSQTITNLIAECLAAGKRVLFVAEKRAALEVVAKRLRQVGLADACLELHSNKAQKREVVLELARVLDLAAPVPAGGAARIARRAEELTRALNAYARAVSRATPLGLSHYDVVGRLLSRDDAPAPELAFPDALRTPSELHARRQEALEHVREAAGALPSVANHPLAALAPAEWSPARARHWERDLRALADAAAALASALQTAAAVSGWSGAPSAAAAEALAEALEIVAAGLPPKAAEIARRADADAVTNRLADDAARARARAADLARVAERFRPSLLELDLDALRAAFAASERAPALIRWWRLRRPRKALAACATGPLPAPAETPALLDAAARARDAARFLEKEDAFLRECLGAAARGADTDSVAMETLAGAVSRWRAALERLDATSPSAAPGNAPPAAAADRGRALEAAAALRSALPRYRDAAAAVVDELRADPLAAFGASIHTAPPDRVRATAERWIEALPLARDWARFIAAESDARALDLGEILAALRRGEVEPDRMTAAYERAFFQAWVEQSFEACAELRGFDGRVQDRSIREFASADAEWVRAAAVEVAQALADARPDPRGAASADDREIANLRREAQKKTRHKSIRRLLGEIPELAARLKPCFLMSPLSIAQYLAPTTRPFDVVVFDEASQIPTHDAVGAIGRGTQVVVVGDSKQLPPTAFFATQRDGEGGDDDERESESETLAQELESILDECVAAGLSSLSLRWHYRSRDERLIAFSNHHYYDGRLQTFPAARSAPKETGVALTRLDGTFDRGGTKTNRAEAEALVAWIVDALRDPARRSRSLGVVTFNQPQQELVLDLLEEARLQHPEIEHAFAASAAEPLFVKNLENVQGDERDVILFSVAFGPDARGHVSMNFGPLNRQGGERRLNVAITRARERLVVFTSLRPDQIELARTRAVGVAHLKSFLRYAEMGPAVLGLGAASKSAAGAGDAPGFDDVVHRALIERGHAVDRRVGCSDYRIDLAVRDPNDPGRYLLGVECDGPSYASAPTARDRDRLRASVLRALGWTLHRVWSTDWYLDPAREIARLEAALRNAAGA